MAKGKYYTSGFKEQAMKTVQGLHTLCVLAAPHARSTCPAAGEPPRARR
jgi:hypothetical protein